MNSILLSRRIARCCGSISQPSRPRVQRPRLSCALPSTGRAIIMKDDKAAAQQRRFASSTRAGIDIDPEVRRALNEGRPVVALESTIISHGMPYPENLEMARGVESVVRAKGAVPATVALLGGRPLVGLTARHLEALAKAGPRARKCSRRDLAVAIAQGVDGATTVASTAYLAALAGIRVFVTGGMGGVHRGAETTFDVSADLSELAQTPIVVVCAGVKSILDVEKTLEVLETNGVPVISYGTDDFPAFFSPSSGVSSPLRLDTAEEVAAAAKAGFDLGMRNGMIVAVPNPSPIAGSSRVDAAIKLALEEAASTGLSGRDVTPFVLARVNEETGGESLKSNVALIRHNAMVGTDIAIQLAAVEHSTRTTHLHKPGARGFSLPLPPPPLPPQPPQPATRWEPRIQAHSVPHPRVAVFGGAVADVVARPYPGRALTPGTSTPGETRQSFGGVGRNIAEGLARVFGLASEPRKVDIESADQRNADNSPRVTLVSVVGADDAGRALVAGCKELGVTARATVNVSVKELSDGGWEGERREGYRTASYIAVLGGNGELVAAVADMRVLETMDSDFVDRHASVISDARVVVADGNLPPQGLARLAKLCTQEGVPLVFEPTSVAKSTVPFSAGAIVGLAVVTPNLDELAAMAMAAAPPRAPKAHEVETRNGPGFSHVHASSQSPVENTQEGAAERMGHALAKDAISADGKFVDAKPLGAALAAIFAAMFRGHAPAEHDSSCSSALSSDDALARDSDAQDAQAECLPVLLDGAKRIVVTMGSAGVLVASAWPRTAGDKRGIDGSSTCSDPDVAAAGVLMEIPDGSGNWFFLSADHYPALPLSSRRGPKQGGVVNCTGAGDCLVAGMVGGLALGFDAQGSVLLGLLCARESVQSDRAVPESMGQLLGELSGMQSDAGRLDGLAKLLPEGYTPRAVDPWGR